MDSDRNRSSDGLMSNYGNNYQFDDNRSGTVQGGNQPVGRFDGQPNQQNTPNPVEAQVALLMPSLEDKMILKTINRESFWFRCVPFALISSACYYYYNEQRKRPHSIFKYTGLAFAAFIAGKFTYLKEGQRRLIESPSNSAFVNELRKKTRQAGGGYNYSSSQYDNYDLNKSSETTMSDWTDPVNSEFAPDDTMLDPNKPSPIHQTPQAATLTYDELRARNRDIYERTSRRN